MKTFTAFITRILNRESKPAKENASPALEDSLPKPFYYLHPLYDGKYDLYYHFYTYSLYGIVTADKKFLAEVKDEEEAAKYVANCKRKGVRIDVSE